MHPFTHLFSRRFSTALAVVMLLVQAAGADAQQRVWVQARTPHFTVISPASPLDTGRVARALEGFRAAFGRLVPGARIDAVAPTIAIAFDRFASYEPFAPRYDGRPVRVAGAFIGANAVNYLTMTLDEGPRAWPVIYHELTHLIVTQTMDRPPAWFNEGIAEYYSTFRFGDEDGAGELGHLIPEHLMLLRRERWLPLDELLDVTPQSSLYNEGDKRSVFYAQSWALIHFLLSDPARTGQLFEYLGRVRDGQATVAAFRGAFGMMPGTLQEQLQRYVQQSEWPVERYSLGQGGPSQVDAGVEPLTDADALSLLAGLQLVFERQDEAMTLAQDAVNGSPDESSGWVVLAAAYVARQMDVEAVPFVLKVQESGLRGPFLQYLFGATIVRILERVNESTMARAPGLALAGRSLERAVAGHATYAEAWAMLAHVRLLSNEPNAALTAARRAAALAPARRQYRLVEAQALMVRGDLEAARRVLDEVIEHEPGTAVADTAAEVLARLAALEADARARRTGGGH